MKNYNSENIDKILDFFIKANTSVKSVNWWEEKLEKILEELDKLESSVEKEDKKKEQALMKELQVILNRAQVELKAIEDLENEIETYLSEKPKKTNSKKVSRKKPI